MKSGHPRLPMRAGNFIQNEARNRLVEIINPAQEKLSNALNVDRYLTILYVHKISNLLCTCQESQIPLPTDKTIPHHISKHTELNEIVIDSRESLFGDKNAFTHDDESNEYEFNSNNSVYDSPDCGICYRMKFLPGFDLFGYQRSLFTTHDIVDSLSAYIDSTEKPNKINIETIEGFCEFVLDIPKYFKEVKFSIRNNHEIINANLYTISNDILSLDYLASNCGKQIVFRCKESQFTHIDISFKISNDLYTNIAQFSKALDYTMLETLSNISVIFDTKIPELTAESFLLLPKKNIMLKISDVNFLREHSNKNMNWETTCRVLQPQERPKNIFKGFKFL